MRKIFLAIAMIASVGLYAQEEHNMVPNPSFEEVNGKIKSGGQVIMAEPWRAINMNPVDLYSTESKSDEYGVPANKNGEEKARTGNNYAGVSFYGYRGRMPRTYLGTRLKNPMTEGREYCLKFFVSLADRSKYAANNLAMYVTSDSIVEQSEKNLEYTPQVKSITNKPFEQQFLWTPICRTYTATGGEQFIIIGNFDTDEDTQLETLRLSREFSGRQSYDAYYFVDDVSVIPTDVMKEDCSCDKIAGGSMEVEFKKFGTDDAQKAKAKNTYVVNSDGSKASETASQAAAATTTAAAGTTTAAVEKKPYPQGEEIVFAVTEFEVNSANAAKLKKLAEYLKANPDVNLKIMGHEDPSESTITNIGKRRAYNVQKTLVDNGVSKTRIPFDSYGTTKLRSETDASKNTIVTFEKQ